MLAVWPHLGVVVDCVERLEDMSTMSDARIPEELERSHRMLEDLGGDTTNLLAGFAGGGAGALGRGVIKSALGSAIGKGRTIAVIPKQISRAEKGDKKIGEKTCTEKQLQPMLNILSFLQKK